MKTIRESDNPVEDFLEKQDISASAFYVLKSRLNQKVESFLLNRLGDPNMEAIHKVFKVYDLIFNSPREIAITTLKKLEKTMLEMDNPLVLMVVYRGLKMMYNADDSNRVSYGKEYDQAVAFYLTTEKAIDAVMAFFRAYDKYYLGRKKSDFNEMVKIIEKVNNLNNLYDSQRIFVCKSIIHLFARQFLHLPERVLEIMEDQDESFERCFTILEKGTEDILFKNINLIFDFLRFGYYHNQGAEIQEKIYFELLDYKIEELLTEFNFGMECSQILFFKLERHRKEGTMNELMADYDEYISKIEVEAEARMVTYVNYTLFQAYVAYYAKNYDNASRILYRLRNKVNLRKFPHMDAEVKGFLAFTYVLQDEVDLANQLILSLQRQFKKPHFADYDQTKAFLKILTNRLSGKTSKRVQQVKKYLEEFNEKNTGMTALLPCLDMNFSLFGKGAN
ncbi:MAG: hypothetical protein AAF998_10780 [Bacteroidota bacterium]